jgi:hypothetical protein
MSETQYGKMRLYVAGASPYRDGRRRAIGTTTIQAWEKPAQYTRVTFVAISLQLPMWRS